MNIAIILIVGIVAGFVGGFFVMRKNPKYFNIDDMIKQKMSGVLAEIEARKDITVDEIKKILGQI